MGSAQHIAGVLARNMMPFRMAFPECAPVEFIVRVRFARSRRLKNLEGYQATVERLSFVTIKSPQIGAINFDLVYFPLTMPR